MVKAVYQVQVITGTSTAESLKSITELVKSQLDFYLCHMLVIIEIEVINYFPSNQSYRDLVAMVTVEF